MYEIMTLLRGIDIKMLQHLLIKIENVSHGRGQQAVSKARDPSSGSITHYPL